MLTKFWLELICKYFPSTCKKKWVGEGRRDVGHKPTKFEILFWNLVDHHLACMKKFGEICFLVNKIFGSII
jgi:hypothetical protein